MTAPQIARSSELPNTSLGDIAKVINQRLHKDLRIREGQAPQSKSSAARLHDLSPHFPKRCANLCRPNAPLPPGQTVREVARPPCPRVRASIATVCGER